MMIGEKMGKNLIFYDGECGFCDCMVQFVLKQDTHDVFDFAPLQGKTASIMLRKLPAKMKNKDSLVLIENYQSSNPEYYVLGKGAFRIMWDLGGFWTIPGVISFLPAFLYNWGYRLVAKNRGKLIKNVKCVIPSKDKKEKFLP